MRRSPQVLKQIHCPAVIYLNPTTTDLARQLDIRFVPREEIDKVKWNSCVHYAGNGNVFGYQWYLDFVGKDWDALVEGDYESVFPLVWRKGWTGGQELYQPSLMRAMGIYSINVLSQGRIRQFLEAIPETFRAVDIHLNARNEPPEGVDFEVEPLLNHQLLLNRPYEALEEVFSAPLREQLRRAEEYELVTTTSLKPETVAEFYLQHTRDRERERNFHAMQRIMYNVLHRGWGYAAGACDPGGELLAVNFYIYSHRRVLSLVPVDSPEGVNKGALPFLFSMLLRSHANRPLILDFNTSGPNKLAGSFGAPGNNFYRLQRNRKLLGIL